MRSKKVIYNIFSGLLLQAIVVIYGFIVPKIIINSFGSNANGLVSSITQFLAYITLLESGFGPVLKSTLYKPIANKNRKSILNILKASDAFFKRISYIFLVYIIVLCLIYPLLVSKNFGWFYTVSLILIISMSTFAEYFFGMTYRLYLQAEQKSYVISMIQIFTYLLSILSIVIMVKLSFSLHMLKFITGLIFIIRPILQNAYVKKKYNINLKEANEKYELKQKWDGLSQHIASVIHTNTDITLLTIFSKLTEVSVYSVYYLIVKGLESLVQAFTSGIDSTFGDMLAKKEKENLISKFNIYEVLYDSINTILFTSAMVLIVPFIAIYTKEITDANYIRYTFGYLIVISEYICMIRSPYLRLTHAAGHFKETRVGAWVECITNIVISVALVIKFGLVGVTIGTIVAMTIRTIEFVYHTNKYILDRSIWESIKKILLVIIETIIIVIICKYLPFVSNISYTHWIINAIMVFIVACIVTIGINYIFYRNEFKELDIIMKRLIIKK